MAGSLGVRCEMGRVRRAGLRPSVDWRLNVWLASRSGWAWIWWMRTVSSVCRAGVVIWLVIGLAVSWLDLSAFSVVFWPVAGLIGLCLLCEGVRVIVILRHAKQVWAPEVSVNEIEEAAIVRSRSLLK